MKLIFAVTGGRSYDNYDHVKRVLDEERPGAIVQGECPYGGADAMAARWCADNGVPCIGIKANFNHYGRGAGPIRNGWMLDLIEVYKVIAFPGGRGTENCVEQARRREILVRDERGVRPVRSPIERAPQ
ncbi:SLOG family protein [Sphingomonas sp. SCN 67-18]|uniref:SLOG family protein n=1 Tax=uncultured Sphingomonas sp. TaxID=158754 RepID=UPI000ABEED06|nr:SLOG family protein [Sphingomonas sp. SCN 67-18]